MLISGIIQNLDAVPVSPKQKQSHSLSRVFAAHPAPAPPPPPPSTGPSHPFDTTERSPGQESCTAQPKKRAALPHMLLLTMFFFLKLISHRGEKKKEIKLKKGTAKG